MKRESLNHLRRPAMERLLDAARGTVALPSAQGAVSEEIPLLIGRLDLYEAQMRVIEAKTAEATGALPAGRALLTVPNVGPVSAATFSAPWATRRRTTRRGRSWRSRA